MRGKSWIQYLWLNYLPYISINCDQFTGNRGEIDNLQDEIAALKNMLSNQSDYISSIADPLKRRGYWCYMPSSQVRSTTAAVWKAIWYEKISSTLVGSGRNIRNYIRWHVKRHPETTARQMFPDKACCCVVIWWMSYLETTIPRAVL